MTRRSRILASGVLFVSLVVAPSEALADDSPSERAEKLYVDGKALASQGNYAEACPKLEESQKLEPAIGTQFNLADCYEHTHRPATALAMFHDVARIAQMSGKHDRQKAAEDRIAELEKTTPRLVVKVTAPPTGTRVEQDGVTLSEADLASGVLVDPGDHDLVVTAPSYLPWRKRVHVDESPAPLQVLVPTLLAEAAPQEAPAPPPPSGLPPLRIAALATASVGVLGIAAGTIFGITAISKKSEAGCAGVDCSGSTPDGARALHDAQSAGTTSTVFFVAGGVLVAAGAALWLVAPKRDATTAFAPVVRASPLGLEGAW